MAFNLLESSWDIASDTADATGSTCSTLNSETPGVKQILANMNAAYDEGMWSKALQDQTCSAPLTRDKFPKWPPQQLLRAESSNGAGEAAYAATEASIAAGNADATSGPMQTAKKRRKKVTFEDDDVVAEPRADPALGDRTNRVSRTKRSGATATKRTSDKAASKRRSSPSRTPDAPVVAKKKPKARAPTIAAGVARCIDDAVEVTTGKRSRTNPRVVNSISIVVVAFILILILICVMNGALARRRRASCTLSASPYAPQVTYQAPVTDGLSGMVQQMSLQNDYLHTLTQRQTDLMNQLQTLQRSR